MPKNYAAFFNRISSRISAAASMLTSVSSENTSILPRIRSEMRGWVTPSVLAASAWVMPLLRIYLVMARISSARAFMLAASPGVSSMASHTLLNRCLLMGGLYTMLYIQYGGSLDPIRSPVEDPFMVRQAHHERRCVLYGVQRQRALHDLRMVPLPPSSSACQ